MKALIYTAPNEMTLMDAPRPALVDGEVVLRVDAVGICGSDMHAFHGHDPRRKPGLILGHELAGTIVEGPGAGRRVTANPLITCGTCDCCVQGRNNLCSHRAMVGMTRPGAFAEYMAIPIASLIDIPQDMDARVAALTEPAATAWHAIHLAARSLVRPLAEAEVLVIGGGAIGLLSALLLGHWGVRVTLVERNPLRRASAATHAGCRTLDPSVGSGGAKENAYPFVIDAVGAKITRDSALAAVQPGGVVLHIGLQDWASEIDMRKLTLAEITLVGTYTYTTADLRGTVAALHGGSFGDLGWVEERALDDGAGAFQDLDRGRSAAAKIVLRPH
ncbi:MAG: alcohol dehydrogenase catalytic domain-containing protein [Burkholderiales bacterium]|nr:alcohol dehydrogenase catalytic domain-containing protein [Burkholderiales bacterium]MCC7219089.1 alcohol dehydrogenase catalytic domain-containing protein [Burkholderiales bacterium]MCE7878836.1 FAD-dependent oxidoreductase [Betaproteobacteria bacterium PRO3]